MFLKSINITLDFMFMTVLDELSLKCVVLPVWKNPQTALPHRHDKIIATSGNVKD